MMGKTGWDAGAVELPSSHVFLTAAYGRKQRTVALPRWVVPLTAILTAAAVLWSLGCTAYVLGHDTLLAAAMRRERDLQYGYEDKIADLQRRLERTTTERAQLERTVGTRLDTLTAQEGELRRRAGTVAALADGVSHLQPSQAAASQAISYPPAADHAEALPDHDARYRSLPGEQTADRLAALTHALGALDRDQQDALGRLEKTATATETRYRAALAEAGLTLTRFGAKTGDAVGGPFVPLDATSVRSPFDRASLALQATLDGAGTLKAAIGHVPFAKPLDGTPEVTSPFGARTDPFLGRPALHTGIDLRDGTGSAVLATAPGRVVSAGPVSGYGLMVELDHGAGLTTRYAHLSAIEVTPGQQVAEGDTIGLVGATGRATGPHLHYETRIDGEPVDPMRFLIAGHHLAQGTLP